MYTYLKYCKVKAYFLMTLHTRDVQGGALGDKQPPPLYGFQGVFMPLRLHSPLDKLLSTPLLHFLYFFQRYSLNLWRIIKGRELRVFISTIVYIGRRLYQYNEDDFLIKYIKKSIISQRI